MVAVTIAVIFSFALYQRANAPVLGDDTVVLQAPDGSEEVIVVEIADDPSERAQGLMEREYLPPGIGMLFVYDASVHMVFWMKNTLIPLDILFFDEAGTFVSRTTMDPCIADPCATYDSLGPARYALEVNRGEANTAQVGTGWILRVSKEY